MVSAWVLCAWLGWALVFAAIPESGIDAATEAPEGFASKFNFTATTIITTGFGDFVPSADAWRVVTGVMSISGLALVTLGITYLIPVTSAAVDRMAFAQRLSTWAPHRRHPPAPLGRGELRAAAAPPRRPHRRDDPARSREPAYPVLHFFHGADPDRAFAPRVAAVDEALTIIEQGIRRAGTAPRAGSCAAARGRRRAAPHRGQPGVRPAGRGGAPGAEPAGPAGHRHPHRVA